MAKKKKNNNFPYSLRPSMMWVWTAVFIAIMGFALFGEGAPSPLKSDWSEVEQLIVDGKVKGIEVVNRDQAMVYLTEDAIQAMTATEGSRYSNIPPQGHQLEFQIGSVDTFRQDFDKATAVAPAAVRLTYDNHRQGWVDTLLNWLPWVFFIVLWILIMRGFGRGGAGGGAGGGMSSGAVKQKE
jgi:cell division protease FtsH